MTTIAYKDGVLAADSRISDEDGHVWTDAAVKIWRLPDGSLLGASGDDEISVMVYAQMKEAAVNKRNAVMSMPEDADFNGILIKANGDLFVSEGSVWTRWYEDFVAIGSGKRCAMTALRLGHTAEEAVAAGVAGDCFSGGPIKVIRLNALFDPADPTK